MTRPLPALDVDLVVEHEGYQAKLQGSGRDFVAVFDTLASLVHFVRAAYPFRKSLPSEYRFQIECKGFRFPRIG